MDMNLECGAGAAVSPNIPAESVATSARGPALPAFLARKLLSFREPLTPRQEIIEVCKAELDWSRANWQKHAPACVDYSERSGPHPSEADRMPHERAAAKVLNCIGHLQPTEHRARELWRRLCAQRKAGWTGERTKGTAADLRWLLAARRTQTERFTEAVAEYRAAREAITLRDAA